MECQQSSKQQSITSTGRVCRAELCPPPSFRLQTSACLSKGLQLLNLWCPSVFVLWAHWCCRWQPSGGRRFKHDHDTALLALEAKRIENQHQAFINVSFALSRELINVLIISTQQDSSRILPPAAEQLLHYFKVSCLILEFKIIFFSFVREG